MKRDYPALLQPPSALAERLPVISVVTCAFQQERYLERAKRSVLEQHYPRLEYIVVDGGSNDGSAETIRRYGHALAYRESGPDRGQTDALVKGFRLASGEIHGSLCSDELLLPGALDAVAAFFSTRPRAMAVYGDALWIDAEGRFLRPKKEMDFNRFVSRHDHNCIPQPSMFWRSALYDAVNGLDPGFDLAMDADLWDRFAALTRVEHMPRYLSCMRWYPQQKTRSRRTEGGQEDRAIRARGGAAGRHALVEKALWMLAHCVRVAEKTRSGCYRADVPGDLLDWLERNALEGAPR
jgi:glycosyltransferase involved in cell wall biosynthesis